MSPPDLIAERQGPPDGEWLRQFVDCGHYDHVLQDGQAARRADGRLLVRVVRHGISRRAGLAMYRAVRDRIPQTNNRGHASGTERYRQRRRDGKLSNTNRAANVQSGILGFFDRYPRIPYCRKTAFVEREGARYRACLPAMREASEVFRAHHPEAHARQQAMVGRTHPDFVIPGTVFTTVTLNRNFRTACHQDAGDLPEGFGVMTAYCGGSFTGGLLVLPAWRVAVRVQSFDVVLFDPHEVHGNTALVPLTRGAPVERITCVHYYRQGMVYCGSAQDELALAKRHDPRAGARRMSEVLK